MLWIAKGLGILSPTTEKPPSGLLFEDWVFELSFRMKTLIDKSEERAVVSASEISVDDQEVLSSRQIHFL